MYLYDLLYIDNRYCKQMLSQIYPTELQLNKANPSDTEAPFLDLDVSFTNGIVSTKSYDQRFNFNFEIVNFPFLGGDIPRSTSYGVYISQFIHFARVCSNVDDFCKTTYIHKMFCSSSSRCRGLVCSMSLWYFLIMLTYFLQLFEVLLLL